MKNNGQRARADNDPPESASSRRTAELQPDLPDRTATLLGKGTKKGALGPLSRGKWKVYFVHIVSRLSEARKNRKKNRGAPEKDDFGGNEAGCRQIGWGKGSAMRGLRLAIEEEKSRCKGRVEKHAAKSDQARGTGIR